MSAQASLLLLLFYAIISPYPLQPHYFMVVWWVGFLFVALALSGLPPAWRRGLGTLAILAVIVNAAFLFSAVGFFKDRHGTPTPYYGATIGELDRAVRRLCKEAEADRVEHFSINVENTPGVSETSLRYLVRHLPECRTAGEPLLRQGSPTVAYFAYPTQPGSSEVSFSLKR